MMWAIELRTIYAYSISAWHCIYVGYNSCMDQISTERILAIIKANEMLLIQEIINLVRLNGESYHRTINTLEKMKSSEIWRQMGIAFNQRR